MNGKEIQKITKGKWDVTKFIGYDMKKKICYYQSAEVSPMERNMSPLLVRLRNQLTAKVSANEPYTRISWLNNRRPTTGRSERNGMLSLGKPSNAIPTRD